MSNYESIASFVEAFPALALSAKDRLQGHDGAFRLETREGHVYELEIHPDGEVVLGPLSREADCTVTASEDDLLAVIQGRLNPATALLLRKIKVRGQISRLMSLIALLG